MTDPGGVIQRLSERVAVGEGWGQALVEAVGDWPSASERIQGEQFVYVVAGEAFDWLKLAERLLRSLPGAVTIEQEEFLFTGVLPDVSPTDFKAALGPAKYRAHLNYFYGVVVEDALWYLAEQDIRKAREVKGLSDLRTLEDDVAESLYKAKMRLLVRRFRKERSETHRIRFTLSERDELIYWLFKLRTASFDAARVASDTRKGLRFLQSLRISGHYDERSLGIPATSIF